MAFKNYNFRLIVLIFIMVISAFVLGWSAFSSRMHLSIILSICVIIETVILYYLMTRTQREVLFFFKALENDDTAIRYTSDHRSGIIDELHHYLNHLNDGFRALMLENEIREKYFSLIIENISSGLMVVAPTGHINHINQEALRLLNVHKLTHIKALEAVNKRLYATVKNLKSLGKVNINLQEKDAGIKRVLGLQSVQVNLQGEDVRMITLQDLSVEMERKEIDDWIRLIRVMSHEIMNSLAPITSISTTLKEVWAEGQPDQKVISDPKIEQTMKGLEAIAEQSEGLTTFFESYRVLSRIPDPKKRDFAVCAMFDKLATLVTHHEEQDGVPITIACEDIKLTLKADEQMITQVMLNLIKNGVQSLDGVNDPRVTVKAIGFPDQTVVLSVADNGIGIPPEIANEIFMPFFTTRKMGTGVGLSYSRQVVNMNDGKIEFESVPGRTIFRLIFG